MRDHRFRRRTFLGSTLAGLLGLAGCSERESRAADRQTGTASRASTSAQQGTPTDRPGTTDGTNTDTGTDTDTETDEAGTETDTETETETDTEAETGADETGTETDENEEAEEDERGALPEHDHSGPESGGSTIVAEQLIHRARDTENVQASASRPLLSTEPSDTYVDPTVGDDSNPGTERRPLRTIQEALDRVPIVVQHRHHIYLADGTYAESPKSAAGHFVGSYPHNPHPMRIQGNPEDPSKVVIDGTPGLSVRSNEMDNPVLTDVTITGSMQNFDSHFQIANIRFTGTGERVLGGAAMKTHDASVTRVQGCSFAESYDFAVEVSLGGTVLFDDNRGTVSEYVFEVDKGATAIEIGSNDLAGREGYARARRGARYIDRSGEIHTDVVE